MTLSRSYLTQAGPLHPKHGGGLQSSGSDNNRTTVLPPLHPFLAFITHYCVAIPSLFMVHDAFFHDKLNNSHQADLLERQDRISCLTLVYVFILFGARYLSSLLAGRLRHHAVLYELTWMCNSTLVIGFISFGGLRTVLMYFNKKLLIENRVLKWLCARRPLAATASCVGVSIDQVLWYLDLVGRAVSGKFPIGVAKYLTWKQTLWIDRLTCTHHLWTIPLFVYSAGDVTLNSFVLSCYVVVIQVLLSRWLTPHHIRIVEHSNQVSISEQKSDRSDPTKFRYLNVNLSHELWRDISFSFLQISKDTPSCSLYLCRLLSRWLLLNFVVFLGVFLPLNNLIN